MHPFEGRYEILPIQFSNWKQKTIKVRFVRKESKTQVFESSEFNSKNEFKIEKTLYLSIIVSYKNLYLFQA